MKFKITATIVACALSIGLCEAQINDTIDSVVQQICKSFGEYEGSLDSEIVTTTFSKHLYKYISKMSEAAGARAIGKVNIRLQTTCQKYVDYTSGFSGKNWIRVEDCPGSNLSDLELRNFFQIHAFKYVESDGDTTSLKLTKTEWIDYMKDGTYSKLSLQQLSPSDFVIKFIESNNIVKTSMSRVGDEYYYSIISKGKNFYTLCASLPKLTGGTLFRLYYK
jgi:hypothetical protein